MKRLLVGTVGAIAMLGVGAGGIQIARANDPEYQQKKNDELIIEINRSVKESDVCKSLQKFKDSNARANSIDIAMAASCARLIDSHIELSIEISIANSNKERREYKKTSDLLIAKSVLWAVKSSSN